MRIRRMLLSQQTRPGHRSSVAARMETGTVKHIALHDPAMELLRQRQVGAVRAQFAARGCDAILGTLISDSGHIRRGGEPVCVSFPTIVRVRMIRQARL